LQTFGLSCSFNTRPVPLIHRPYHFFTKPTSCRNRPTMGFAVVFPSDRSGAQSGALQKVSPHNPSSKGKND
jgi:hypothetical protein